MGLHGELHAFVLSSTEPASVVEGLDNQLVSPGSAAHFTCAARGSPSPNITWLFNANPIVPSRRFQISGSSLIITDVTQQDVGVYQCLLYNGIGSAQSSATLTILSGIYPITFSTNFLFDIIFYRFTQHKQQIRNAISHMPQNVTFLGFCFLSNLKFFLYKLNNYNQFPGVSIQNTYVLPHCKTQKSS